MPAFTNSYNDLEDLQVRGVDDARKFILANYKRFSLIQLTDILEVDMEFITETLAPTQYHLIGSKRAASILIIKDNSLWDEDTAIPEDPLDIPIPPKPVRTLTANGKPRGRPRKSLGGLDVAI